MKIENKKFRIDFTQPEMESMDAVAASAEEARDFLVKEFDVSMTNIKSVKEIHTCPKCGNEFTEHPALSRRDNLTEICPDCGMKEALEDYHKAYEREGELK